MVDLTIDREGAKDEWSVWIPGKESRICLEYDARRIPMYDILFGEMGLQLPFSDFKVAVFRHLRLIPSQFHPNLFSFPRAIDIVCDYL